MDTAYVQDKHIIKIYPHIIITAVIEYNVIIVVQAVFRKNEICIKGHSEMMIVIRISYRTALTIICFFRIKLGIKVRILMSLIILIEREETYCHGIAVTAVIICCVCFLIYVCCEMMIFIYKIESSFSFIC